MFVCTGRQLSGLGRNVAIAAGAEVVRKWAGETYSTKFWHHMDF